MPADPAWIEVEVAYSAQAGQVDRVPLRLPAPASAADALHASGLLQRHGLQADNVNLGVWGRRCDGTQPLRERDRVEIYRPLIVDPKEARRLRYRKHRGAATP